MILLVELVRYTTLGTAQLILFLMLPPLADICATIVGTFWMVFALNVWARWFVLFLATSLWNTGIGFFVTIGSTPVKFLSVFAVLVEYGIVVGLKISLCILSNILIAHFGDENVPIDWENIGTFEDVDVNWVRQTTDEPRAARAGPGDPADPLLPLYISGEDRDWPTPSRVASHEPVDADPD